MKLFNKRPLIAAAVAAALMGLSATAISQNANPPPEQRAQQRMGQHGAPGAKDPARMAKMQQKMAERHAAHMAKLKADLKITAAQEASWNTFVAGTAPEARKPMAAAADTSQLTTPQRLDLMQAHKAERDAKMAQRIDATKAFYATLAPEQQKVFDAQGQRGMRHAGQKGEHRMGGKGQHGGHSGMDCESGSMHGGMHGRSS